MALAAADQGRSLHSGSCNLVRTEECSPPLPRQPHPPCARTCRHSSASSSSFIHAGPCDFWHLHFFYVNLPKWYPSTELPSSRYSKGKPEFMLQKSFDRFKYWGGPNRNPIRLLSPVTPPRPAGTRLTPNTPIGCVTPLRAAHSAAAAEVKASPPSRSCTLVFLDAPLHPPATWLRPAHEAGFKGPRIRSRACRPRASSRT